MKREVRRRCCILSSRTPLMTLVPFLMAGGIWGPVRSSAHAVEPSVSYIFPAGGQQGQTVAVRVGGHFLHGQAKFTMDGPGIAASPTVTEGQTIWFEGPVLPLPASQRAEDYPRDHHGQIKIAKDAEPGYRRWRVQTAQGITPSMLFVVGELPELVEEEVEGEPIPVEVQLPITINGRIFPREDVDIWQFAAQKGQTYYAEVHAARLGSALQSRLEVLDPEGRPLAENSGFFGADAFVSFTAPRDGNYEIRIHDSEFGGLQHYVYRLTIDKAPYVTQFYPLGGERGGKVSLQLAGPGLDGATTEVQLPRLGDEEQQVWVRPHWQGRKLNPLLLEVSDRPEFLEVEPNNNLAQAQLLQIPGVANGRLNEPGDVDIWAVGATADTNYQVNVRAAQLGSPLDAVLTVMDAQGKVMATADDTGNSTDPSLYFQAKTAGTYYLQVSERFSPRGGPEFAYRMQIEPAEPLPGFEVVFPVETINVTPGGEAKLKLDIVRTGGFTGSVEISAADLPEGITLGGNVIPGNRANTQLSVKCEETVEAPLAVPLRLVARGEQVEGPKGKERRSEVEGKITSPAARGTPDIANRTLFVGLATPFKFSSDFSLTYAPQGSILKKRYTVDRGGYTGPLTVRLADKQMRHLQGVTGPTIVVAADADEFEYPVTLPSFLEIGRTSRTVLMAMGEVTDRHGQKHIVSYTSTNQNEQIVAVADPASLTLRAEPQSIVADPGRPVAIRVQVDQAANVSGNVRLEVRTPQHMRGVSAAAVELEAGAREGTILINFAREAGPFNAPLIIRATARGGEQIFLAETTIEVVQLSEPGN